MNVEVSGCRNEKLVVKLQFDAESVSVTETPLGVEIDLPGARWDGTPGAPALPIVAFDVALPPGKVPGGLRVSAESVVPLTDGREHVAALQPAAPGVRRCSQLELLRDDGLVRAWPRPPFVPPDEELYARALEELAKAPARLASVALEGPQALATIVAHPVVLGDDGQLLLHTELLITIPLDDAPDEGAQGDVRFASHAQAVRWTSLTRSRVINPELVIDISGHIARYLGPAEYLIITDNQRWDAEAITPTGNLSGDMVAEFERLAAWKRKKGLSARVVTISDIVDGRYGTFNGWCRRDLQEVLREFVKWAHDAWGSAWLLLGGDIDVVPVRSVVGYVGGFSPGTADPPGDGGSFWTGSFLKVRAGVGSDTPLLRSSDGHRIPYDATGASSATQAGWYFTDSTFATRSTMPTGYVRVNGPAAQVNTELFWLTGDNTIPTDLYYADVAGYPARSANGTFATHLDLASRGFGPLRFCGGHDWDQVDNELYGQWNTSGDLDGVHYHADLSVGRAPVGSAAEAKNFVDKVIAYEQQSGWFTSSSWLRKLLMVSSNWGGRTAYGPNATLVDDHYTKAPASDHAVIQLSSPPASNVNLLSVVTENDERELPFSLGASPAHRGWCYAVSGTDATPSKIEFQVPWSGNTVSLPIPSRWIVAYGSPDEMSPTVFVLDDPGADGSMLDQETLRSQLAADVPAWSDVMRLYEDDVDLSAAAHAAAPLEHLSASRLEAQLDLGPHVVSLSGHGYWGGCCGLNPSMRTSLNNGTHTFVGYADSCLTNQFDVSDAVSEELVNNDHGGAVAYVGNTRFSWINVGDDFQRNFFRGLPYSRALGVLHDRRLLMLGANTGFWPVYNRWSIFSLNLIGDPELHVWTHSPWRLCLEVPAAIHVDEQLHVQVLHGNSPVPGAHVTIEQTGFERRSHTDFNGIATFDLSGAARGDLEVAAYHPDAALFTTTIRVRAPYWLEVTISGIRTETDVTTVSLSDGAGERTVQLRDDANQTLALLGQALSTGATARVLLADDAAIDAVELLAPETDSAAATE